MQPIVLAAAEHRPPLSFIRIPLQLLHIQADRGWGRDLESDRRVGSESDSRSDPVPARPAPINKLLQIQADLGWGHEHVIKAYEAVLTPTHLCLGARRCCGGGCLLAGAPRGDCGLPAGRAAAAQPRLWQAWPEEAAPAVCACCPAAPAACAMLPSCADCCLQAAQLRRLLPASRCALVRPQ